MIWNKEGKDMYGKKEEERTGKGEGGEGIQEVSED